MTERDHLCEVFELDVDKLPEGIANSPDIDFEVFARLQLEKEPSPAERTAWLVVERLARELKQQ